MTAAQESTRPEPRRNRSPSVVELIKDYIVEHRLRPGDAMPTESTLSVELGVSRSSVREAVKTLTALDIVDVRHGHGTYVGRMSLSALVESLAFRGTLLSPDDSSVISDLVDIREMLETGLATATVDAITDAQVEQMRVLAEQMMTNAKDKREFLEQDRAFHLILMNPTGNQLAVQLTGAFWDIHSIVSIGLSPVSDLIQTAQAHLDIVDATESRDVAALRRAISQHYEPIRERIPRMPESP